MSKKNMKPSLKQLLDRRMAFYPGDREKSIFIAYCFNKGRKKAELLREVVRDFIDKIPETEQNNLLALYKEMTLEQRKHPYKFEIGQF